LFDASRPVILNGIEDIVTRPDLADRALFLMLDPIPEERRRPAGNPWLRLDVEEWLERVKLPENTLLLPQIAPIWLPQDAQPVFDPWQTYIVPDFPLEILPDVVRRYVVEQSRVIGCDASAATQDHPGLPVVSPLRLPASAPRPGYKAHAPAS
jgi:hypothetical protein